MSSFPFVSFSLIAILGFACNRRDSTVPFCCLLQAQMMQGNLNMPPPPPGMPGPMAAPPAPGVDLSALAALVQQAVAPIHDKLHTIQSDTNAKQEDGVRRWRTGKGIGENFATRPGRQSVQLL